MFCSFRWSSFSRSPASRWASRSFRSSWSCLSRRASADSSCPFFSSSSRSLSSSTLWPSSCFCMPTLSFSSCSRAWTPACERARMRRRSTYPMRVAGGACARAGVSTHHRPVRPTSTAPRIPAIVKPLLMPLSFRLERRAHRELDFAELLALLPVRIDPIVHPNGPEGRVPPEPGPDGVFEIGQVDRCVNALVRTVDVADIEEHGRPEPVGQGHGILEVAQHLEISADGRARRILRRDLAGLEASDGVRAAEVVALEERHRVLGPAELVGRGEAPAEYVIEPQRLVLRDRGRDADVAIVSRPDAREIGPDGGEVAACRLGQ